MKKIIRTPLNYSQPHVYYCYINPLCVEELLQIVDDLKGEEVFSKPQASFQTIGVLQNHREGSDFIRSYFGTKDLEKIWSLKTLSGKQNYMVSRIAMKDAACHFLREKKGEDIPPHELYCTHNPFGQPIVHREGWLSEPLNSLFISLSHKDNQGVAIVSNQPVGIDIEKIESKSEAFLQFAYTKKELSLIEDLNPSGSKAFGTSETVIRFWVAKESCAKKTGRGFQGKPQAFEVTGFEGDVIRVGDTLVQTTEIGENYIVGWTF